MPFSQIIQSSPSPTESKRLFYTSVSLLLTHIQGYRYLFLNSIYMHSVQFSSVAQLWVPMCDPMNCSTPGLPVHQQLLEFKLMPIESVTPSSHLILCHPLLLLLPVPPSIRVFSNESALHMRWPSSYSSVILYEPHNRHIR